MGIFVGQGSNMVYIDGKKNWFDYCEVDSWSLLCLEDFEYEVHYVKNSTLKVYWQLPGKCLCDGPRIIASDTDTSWLHWCIE